MDLKREQEKHQRMQDGVWILLDELTRVKVRSTLARIVRRTARDLEDALRRRKGYLPDHDLDRDEQEEISKQTIFEAGLVKVEERASTMTEDWSPDLTEDDERRAWLDMEHVFLRVSNLMANEGNFDARNLEVLRKNS